MPFPFLPMATCPRPTSKCGDGERGQTKRKGALLHILNLLVLSGARQSGMEGPRRKLARKEQGLPRRTRRGLSFEANADLVHASMHLSLAHRIWKSQQRIFPGDMLELPAFQTKTYCPDKVAYESVLRDGRCQYFKRRKQKRRWDSSIRYEANENT